MKKIVLMSFMFIFLACVHQANAQVSVNLRLNIGSQPCWGPTGYDHAEYYYLPDIEAYYYVAKHKFVYRENERWIFSSSLPPRYSDYNLNTGYKVVINEPNPYMHFEEHRVQYARYKAAPERQPIIHESTDDRYRRHWDDRRYGMRDHRSS